jgi:hypothetical protein
MDQGQFSWANSGYCKGSQSMRWFQVDSGNLGKQGIAFLVNTFPESHFFALGQVFVIIF